METQYIFAIIALLIPVNLFATDSSNSTNQQENIPLIKKTPTPTHGTRMPSNQLIWFSYNNVTQQCEVAINDDIEYLSVTIEQLPVGFYYIGNVSLDCTTFSVAIPSGYYRITGTTEEGVTYIGEGEIN